MLHISQKVGRIWESNDIPLGSLVTLYLTLIQPYFRYCNTVWGNCKQDLLNKLQTLQNRAARIVTRIRYLDADHETILKKLQWLNVRQLAVYEHLFSCTKQTITWPPK